MKYFFSTIIFFSLLLDINAQEVQSELFYNRAYENLDNLKSNSGLFDVCASSTVDFKIIETIKPDCDSTNGEIKIEIFSNAGEANIFLNGTKIESTDNTIYTSEGIKAGAQEIKVTADGALPCERFLTIDDKDSDGLNPDWFVIKNAFCGQGQIRKETSILVDITDFDIFNLQNEIVGSLVSFPKNLDPGNYYVREKGGGTTCEAYFGFTIKDIPSNSVPFVEDFSQDLIFPNPNRWEDNQAFVNRSFALSPYTLGVGTLDGLNEFGLPYRVSDQLIDRGADSLTTHAFCLDNFDGDQLFLSFLFQAQGVSDFPDGSDSLIVEALDSKDNWNRLWSVGGEDSIDNTIFESVELIIKNDSTFEEDQTYFFDGFKFRFRNTATVTGMNDPWHIDYIQLKDLVSSIRNDVAFVYDMRPLLTNYYSMPWNQFYNYQEKEFVDSIRFTARFNDNDPGTNADLTYSLYELCDSVGVDSSSPVNIFGPINETFAKNIPLNITELPNLGQDKTINENVVLRCDLTFQTDNDFLELNDTLRYNQIFSNYFSYDDGSAEKAYGLFGNGGQLAVKFEANEAISLQGVQIYFTHIVGDVSQNRFSIKAWNKLDINENGTIAREDELINSKSDLVPQYTGQIGGFSTYLFDDPVMVDSTFYIGFEQDENDILNLGQDVNNLEPSDNGIPGDMQHIFAHDKIFYNTNGVWTESILAGAVMIRPIVGDRILEPTSITTLTKTNFLVYPNPTTGLLNISVDGMDDNYQVKIYDMTGKELMNIEGTNTPIDVSNFAAGMYLIKLTDLQNKTIAHSKFVKN